ncbi:primase alpha helix C-terminal domain-containing protein [Vagococcus elongatus]|nr:primase alpha helix C-terminal domain-containing protein [Vagococcus elongatus]
MCEPLDQEIIDFFSGYQPLQIKVSNNQEEQTKIKTMKIDGFIAGEMSSLIRKNDNLINRDCLILDLDDVIQSEEGLVKVILEKLSKYEYVLYPSMTHGINGVRYRLVIPLDKPVTEQDYKLLVYFFTNKVLDGVIHKADQSNLTWSQIMLLPVLTQHITVEQIHIHKSESKLSVEKILKAAKRWEKDYTPDTGGVRSFRLYKNVGQFKKGGSRYRNTTTELFESLVNGCDVGNRNNRIAQLTGGLLARAVDVTAVLELVRVANQYFNEPLSDKEVEDTFYSIAKKELGAS